MTALPPGDGGPASGGIAVSCVYWTPEANGFSEMSKRTGLGIATPKIDVSVAPLCWSCNQPVDDVASIEPAVTCSEGAIDTPYVLIFHSMTRLLPVRQSCCQQGSCFGRRTGGTIYHPQINI